MTRDEKITVLYHLCRALHENGQTMTYGQAAKMVGCIPIALGPTLLGAVNHRANDIITDVIVNATTRHPGDGIAIGPP
jgi:alkylated DNA nucleotide flippase Atl1